MIKVDWIHGYPISNQGGNKSQIGGSMKVSGLCTSIKSYFRFTYFVTVIWMLDQTYPESGLLTMLSNVQYKAGG